jgi:hypothetical protein
MKDEAFASKLAVILGISKKDLAATKWELKESKDNNNMVLFRRIVFLAGSPPAILEKIAGLDNNNMFWLEKDALEGMELG